MSSDKKSDAMAASQLRLQPSLSLLPDHVLHLVLAALLPPLELSRLRSVCKSWLSASSSPEFLHLYKQLHPPLDSWLSLYDHRSARVLSWSSLQSRWLSFEFPSFWVRDWAAAGGLLCLRCHPSRAGITETGYFVGNPFTGAWMQLPSPPKPEFGKIWSIGTFAAGKQFCIIILHSASASMQVYDSKTGTWSLTAMPQSVVGSHGWMDVVLASNATGIGETIYCIHGATRSIITFDVKRDLWKRLDAPVPEALAFHLRLDGSLIETIPKIVRGPREEVLLVGALSGEYEGMESMGVVWELDRMSMIWREVTRAPSEMWKSMLEEARESREPSLLPVKYEGEGELIFITASGCSRALKYSLLYGTWDWLEAPAVSNCDLSSTVQPSIDAHL